MNFSRPSSAAATAKEPVWHPPLPRPRTATAIIRTADASQISKQGTDDFATKHEELNVLAARQLEQLYLQRRSSRPASASLNRAVAAVHRLSEGDSSLAPSPDDKQQSNDVTLGFRSQTPTQTATRPSSASTFFRTAVLSEVPNDVRVLNVLEEQLRSSVDLNNLRSSLEAQLDDALVPCGSPLERYEAYKAGMHQSCQAFPTVARLLDTVFKECDLAVEEMRRRMSTSNVDVTTTAMREAISEAARATKVAEAAEQRVRDLERVVSELTQHNVQHAKNQDQLEGFMDEIKAAISSTISACVYDVTPPASTSMRTMASAPALHSVTPPLAALHMPMASAPTLPRGARRSSLQLDGPTTTTSEPLMPDASVARRYIDGLRRLQRDFEIFRHENHRLAELAASALEQHAQQSAEMVELLDRANGFQTHVGNLKSTMRVMKSYIEKLEERVLVLSEASDRSIFGELRASAASCDAADADLSRTVLDMAMWNTLQSKAGAIDHLTTYAPVGGLAQDQLDATIIIKRIRDQFANMRLSKLVAATQRASNGASDAELEMIPAHLAQIALPKLVQRPFEGLLGITAFIQDVVSGYAPLCEANTPGSLKTFDTYLAESYLRRAPAASPKAACEMALTAHHMAQRYERQSILCYLYLKTSSRELPGDFWFHYPRHLAALRDRLRSIEPISKKFKDKIPRTAFLAAIREAWPLVRDEELTAISGATVLGATMDSTKVTEDVAYEAYFEKPTAGTTHVNDTLIRVMAACCVRLITRAKQACCQALEDDAKKRSARVARERLASRGAEVRRMMALDASEIAGPTGVVNLGEVLTALKLVDPLLRPRDQQRLLASLACSTFFFTTDPELAAYGEALDSTKMHVEVMELRWRRIGCHMVTTAVSPPDFPPAPPATPERAIASTTAS